MKILTYLCTLLPNITSHNLNNYIKNFEDPPRNDDDEIITTIKNIVYALVDYF